MEDTDVPEIADDGGGLAYDGVADDSSLFPDTPWDADGHPDHQWYGAHTAAAPGSHSSVTGEVLDAWFGADAIVDPDEPKPSWDDYLDEAAGEDGVAPPWEETEPSAYA